MSEQPRRVRFWLTFRGQKFGPYRTFADALRAGTHLMNEHDVTTGVVWEREDLDADEDDENNE